MRFKLLAVMLVAGSFMCPAIANATSMDHGAKYTLSFSKDYTPSAWTNEMGYMAQAKHKFMFGAKNTLFGWLELYDESKESMDQGEGFLIGLGRGIVNTIGDTLGGVLHFATSPITVLDIPLPEGGMDML